MKKLVTITALFVATSAVTALTSCTAQTTPKANMKTETDSLSYAVGVAYTQGLHMYLNQMGVDSVHMNDFIRGLNEGVNIKKDDKKTNAHMAGIQIGQQLMTQMLPRVNQDFFGSDSIEGINKDNFLAGFVAATLNKGMLMTNEEAQTYMSTTGEAIKEKEFEKQNGEAKASNAKFLEENKGKEGVQTLPSGLQYKVISEGKGAKPTAEDMVKVHYTGTLTDGTKFDSSVDRGEPATFGVGQVIAGWTEGLQLMPVGSKYMFYIPYDLAYGAQGRPGSIPPYATLVFEVELLGIEK